MTTTQQPEALNLEEFRAKVTRAAREPLLARIAELEAQLSAIGAGGVEPLRKAAKTAGKKDATDWKEIALALAQRKKAQAEITTKRAAQARNKKGEKQ